jgi:hypothetical protein
MSRSKSTINVSEELAASFIRMKLDEGGSLAGSSTMLVAFLFFYYT